MTPRSWCQGSIKQRPNEHIFFAQRERFEINHSKKNPVMHGCGDFCQVWACGALLYCCLFVQFQPIDGTTTTGNIFVNKTSDFSNDCEGIIAIPSFPFRAGGDTAMARLNLPLTNATANNLQVDLSSCENGALSAHDIASPALWYMIHGTDHYVKAVIETADNSEQPFAVFKGSDCGKELEECIRGDSPWEQKNLVTWFAEKGNTYYLKVYGDPDGEDSLFVVDFMSSETPRPSNDHCQYAEPLQMGKSVTGMTLGAWPLEIEDKECHLGRHSQTLFYSVQGTGTDIELAFRADVTEGMLGLAILEGENCSKCIAHSGYMSASDSEHTVRFSSKEGTQYKIVVSGEDVFDAGLFHLTIQDNQTSAASLFRSEPFALMFSALLALSYSLDIG